MNINWSLLRGIEVVVASRPFVSKANTKSNRWKCAY